MILFINACVRSGSRTRRLAGRLLEKLGTYEEVDLNGTVLQPLRREKLQMRTAYIEAGDYRHAMFDPARQFAAADEIVIAAPYWDDSFPAVLKEYLENIYVTGIVSRYGKDGRPVGLCKARRLYYITTAGGPYSPDFSYNYVKKLAEDAFGIPETHLIKAEMLDVEGFDPEKILEEAESEIHRLFISEKDLRKEKAD